MNSKTSRQQHWQTIYQQRDSSAVSWFRPHLEFSLAAIQSAVAAQSLTPLTACILDVGAGCSTLVDDLLSNGFGHVAVLDIAEAALAIAQRRLGDRAHAVRWICADLLTTPALPHVVDVWHDRAVFHFLCDPAQRSAYLDLLRKTLAPGGHAILSTFGPEGPERCSGLPATRYSAAELAQTFGEDFLLLHSSVESHRTPAGGEQQFLLAHFERRV